MFTFAKKLLLSVLLVAAQLPPIFATIPADIVANYALNAGFGFKTANLFMLEKIINQPTLQTELSSLGLSVAVPEFVGISSTIGDKFVSNQKIDLEDQWNQSNSSSSTKKRKRDNTIALDHGNNIAAMLKKASGNVTKAFNALNLEVLDFITNAQKSTWQLMVRSSGNEDTDKISNAGGNQSKNYINPQNATELMSAINKVIASYYKSKSLVQRADAGDETTNLRPPSSVLLQRIIGEPNNGTDDVDHIPVSCVVYTQESFANTRGVTLINAAYGHGDLVVNSMGGLDTFYVDSNDTIHYALQKKSERLVPVKNSLGTYDLEPKINPQTLQDTPCLDKDAVLAIKKVADAIHASYGTPMDIELVYMPYEKIIYLVQARPLVVQQKLSPQYITAPEKLDQKNIVHGQTVTPGDCSIKHIDDKNQIITDRSNEMAKTLENALAIFVKPRFIRNNIRAVIVEKQASPTSHAAATFHSTGKVIFIADDPTRINQWLGNKALHFCIDVQRGMLINQPADDIQISNGFLKHPIPAIVSIPDETSKNTDIYMDDLPDKTLQELFDTVNDDNQPLAKQALDTILARIQQKEQMLCALTPHYAQAAHKKIQSILSYAELITQQIKNVLALDPHDIKRLYHIRFLEALLFQKERTDRPSCYSLTSVMNAYERTAAFERDNQTINLKNLYQYEALFALAQQGFEMALTPELATQWVHFLNTVVATDDNETVVTFLNNLDQDTLSIFINNYFYNLTQISSSIYNSTLHQLKTLKTDIESASTQLATLTAMQQKLNAYNVDAWGDPDQFEKLFDNLKEPFIAFFTSHDLKTILDSENTLLVPIAIALMNSFVDLFDRSIKKLKSCTDPDIHHFKVMIQAYFKIFSNWTQKLVPDQITCNPGKPLKAYLDKLKLCINTLPETQNQMYPTPKFNVASATFNAPTELSYQDFETGEDCFTLIHQNLLIVLSSLSNKTADFAAPDLFTNVEEKILALTDAYRLGTIVKDSILTSRYNIPLKLHGLAICLTYDKKLPDSVTLSLLFIGSPDHDRWNIISDFANIFSTHDAHNNIILSDSNIVANKEELHLTFSLSEKSNLNLLNDWLTFMTEYTNIKIINSNLLSQILQQQEYVINVSKINFFEDLSGFYNKFKLAIQNCHSEAEIDYLPQIIKNAQEALNRKSSRACAWGSRILTQLVKENRTDTFDAVFAAAVTAAKNPIKAIQAISTKLIAALAKQDYQPAIEKAKELGIAMK